MSYKTTRDYNFIWRLIEKGERLIYFSFGNFDKVNIIKKVSPENNFTNREEFIKRCKLQRIEFILPDAWIEIKSENDYPVYLNMKNVLVSDGKEVHEAFIDKDYAEINRSIFLGEEAIPFPKGWVKYWRIMPIAPEDKT